MAAWPTDNNITNFHQENNGEYEIFTIESWDRHLYVVTQQLELTATAGSGVEECKILGVGPFAFAGVWRDKRTLITWTQ